MVNYNMRKKYNAFTLTEILLAMGVIIILGSIAVGAVRYATQRSREAQYKSNVRFLSSILVQFKSDYGRYPLVTNEPCMGCVSREVLASGLGYRGRLSGAFLQPYFTGGFDGGIEATYYYYVQETDGQFAIVCVSLLGAHDRNNPNNRYYCDGDGLGILPIGDSQFDPLPKDNYIEPDTQGADFIRNRMDQNTWIKNRFTNL